MLSAIAVGSAPRAGPWGGPITLAKHWPHHPGEEGAVTHDRGPNAWPHEAGENANPWPHQLGDWQIFKMIAAWIHVICFLSAFRLISTRVMILASRATCDAVIPLVYTQP